MCTNSLRFFAALSFTLAMSVVIPRLPGQEPSPVNPPKLNMQSIKRLISDIGFEPKEHLNDKGEPARYVVNVPSSGKNWLICIDISPNQENIWIYANLATPTDPKNLPKDILEEMLKTNEAIGPSYFAYDPKASMFVLYHAVTNQNVSPGLLRRRIDNVASLVDKYEKVWNPKFWGTGASDPKTLPVSPAIQKLIADLSSSDDVVRMLAAKELGKLGPAASPALSALQRLLQDPDEDLRRVATAAIGRIQSQPVAPPTPPPSPPVVPPNVPTLVGSLWTGSENLAGFGELSFRFEAEGKAVMKDAKTAVNGTWSQTGNQVTISFNNCVYQGTLQDDKLTGTARYSMGEAQWTFSVTRTNAAPRAPALDRPAPMQASAYKPESGLRGSPFRERLVPR